MGYLRVCQYSLYPFEVSVSLKYKAGQFQKKYRCFLIFIAKMPNMRKFLLSLQKKHFFFKFFAVIRLDAFKTLQALGFINRAQRNFRNTF